MTISGVRAPLVAIVLVTAALAHPHPVEAQIGVLGGANFATVDHIQVSSVGETLDMRSGFHAGVFAMIGSGRLRLRPNLLYVNTGTLFEGASFLTTDRFNLSYLAFPLDVQFRVKGPIYAFASPEVQYLISYGIQNDFDDDLRSVVVKAGAGLGFQVGPAFIEGRYLFGLRGLTEETFQVGTVSVEAGTRGHDAIRASAGFRF